MTSRSAALLGATIAVVVYGALFVVFSAPVFVYALLPLYVLPHVLAAGWLVPRLPGRGLLLSALVHAATTVVLMPLLLVGLAILLGAPEMLVLGWGMFGSPLTVLALLIGALTGLRYLREPHNDAGSPIGKAARWVSVAALLTVLGLQAITWAPEDLYLTRCSSSCSVFLRTPLSRLCSIVLATGGLVLSWRLRRRPVVSLGVVLLAGVCCFEGMRWWATTFDDGVLEACTVVSREELRYQGGSLRFKDTLLRQTLTMTTPEGETHTLLLGWGPFRTDADKMASVLQ